jgi:hypothetical protein
MAKAAPIYTPEGEASLMKVLWSPDCKDDPLKFVMFAYPWGKPGTPLAERPGPRQWQKDVLTEIAAYIKEARHSLYAEKTLLPMFKEAVASGRGIGKSALFSWLAHWMVTTRLGSSVWVAANSEPQLKDKTFPEIGKWVSMSMNAHWFDYLATSIRPAEWLTEMVRRDLKIDSKYWYISAQLWSEENPDAFAGAHNDYGEMALFDEASGIPSPIWTVQQGVFTEQIVDRYWLAFSNPRRNSGAFYECFYGDDRDNWRRKSIDARTVDIAPDMWKAIIAKHGPDSDEARVEVYGQFPNQGDNQFIPSDMVDEAQRREPIKDPGAPLLMGVDVARSLDKGKTVIAFRKGRDAKSIPWQVFKIRDNVKIAGYIADAAARYDVDAIFIDGGGVGGGVVDILKSWGYKPIEVQFGSGANDSDKYSNKRTEMWDHMKEWLSNGSIPGNTELKGDLIGPEYEYHPVTNKLVLESKEHMLETRRLASPDEGDALAITFAQPIARRDTSSSRNSARRLRFAKGVDYDIFGQS